MKQLLKNIARYVAGGVIATLIWLGLFVNIPLLDKYHKDVVVVKDHIAQFEHTSPDSITHIHISPMDWVEHRPMQRIDYWVRGEKKGIMVQLEKGFIFYKFDKIDKVLDD